MGCVQWYAKEGRDGWDNNYLCAEIVGHPPEGELFESLVFFE